MASFIEMVADIQNVKYPKIIEIFEEITKKDFNGDGDIGLQKIRDDISAFRVSIEALEKNILTQEQIQSMVLETLRENNATQEQIRFMVLEALGENNDTDTKDYFAGIEVKERGFFKEGYSVVYDPAQTPKENGTYTSKATLTYYDKESDMTYTKTFTFEETVNADTNAIIAAQIKDGYSTLFNKVPTQSDIDYWTSSFVSGGWNNTTLIQALVNGALDADRVTVYNAGYRPSKKDIGGWINNFPSETYLFSGVNITGRTSGVPSGYSVSFNPTSAKTPTTSVQTYTVTATVTYSETDM